jgi:hypothetical protein
LLEERAKEDDLPLFSVDASKLVGAALEPLERLAHIADASAADVRKARRAMEEARQAVKPAEALCDIVTAARLNGERLAIDLEKWDSV